MNDVVKDIVSTIKPKLNVLFINNLKCQARRIISYFSLGKMKKNKVVSPDGDFCIVKNIIFFQGGFTDIGKILSAISLSRNKIFEYLKARNQKFKPFSSAEKHFLRDFQKKIHVPKNTIPCKSVRQLC